MEFFELGYLGLFLAAFLAATVIPLSSEGVLVAMLLGGYDPFLCLAVASVANTAGGLTSYFLGYVGKWQWIEKYLKVKREKVGKWKGYADRYGAFIAVLCWVPIIGDILAVALGFWRVNAFRVAVWMFLGKFLRYAAVIYITTQAEASMV